MGEVTEYMETEYHVRESIFDDTTNGGQYMFTVKWYGSPIDDGTSEHVHHLRHSHIMQ